MNIDIDPTSKECVNAEEIRQQLISYVDQLYKKMKQRVDRKTKKLLRISCNDSELNDYKRQLMDCQQQSAKYQQELNDCKKKSLEIIGFGFGTILLLIFYSISLHLSCQSQSP